MIGVSEYSPGTQSVNWYEGDIVFDSIMPYGTPRKLLVCIKIKAYDETYCRIWRLNITGLSGFC